MNRKRNSINVSYFLRQPRSAKNHSIERLFKTIFLHLDKERYTVVEKICPFNSNGIFRRIALIIWAAFNQGDINHVTGDIDFIAIGLRPDRTILTIHDTASMSRLHGWRQLIYRWIWLRLPVSRARFVTVVSANTEMEIRRHVGKYFSKIRVIPNCVPAGLSPYPKEFNNRVPRILQIGTSWNKNLETVIASLIRIPCKLSIVGPLSEQQKYLLKKANINFTNAVGLTDRKMHDEYIHSDMVVFISKYEGFGLPILEAQAIGRPIITSCYPPMSDVAGDGAFLVDPDDLRSVVRGIKKIIGDEKFRRALVCRGYKNVEKYDARKIANQYMDIYDEMLFC